MLLKNNKVKPTTKFFIGKKLIFAEISLKSFICSLVEKLYFLNKRTKEIYDKFTVEKVFPFYVLTDMHSTSLFFIFICKPESNIPHRYFRDLLFQIFVNNEISNRLGTSHELGINTTLEINLLKNLSYYDIEHVGDLCQVTPKTVKPKRIL